MIDRSPKSRAEAARNLMEAAKVLMELAEMPVDPSTERRAVVRARRAVDDYEDAGQRDLKNGDQGA